MKHNLFPVLLPFIVVWIFGNVLLVALLPGGGWLPLANLYVVPVYVVLERGFDHPVSILSVLFASGSFLIQLSIGLLTDWLVSRRVDNASLSLRGLWQVVALGFQVGSILGLVSFLTR